MMVRRLRIVMLVVAPLTMSTLSASAETETFTDRANDARRGVDIRSVRVTNADRIVVRTTFDHLFRREATDLTVYVDTKRRNRGPEYIAAGGTFVGTDWDVFRVDGWHDGNPTLVGHCDIRFRLHFGPSGRARVDIARGCLGHPDVIRVSTRARGPGPNDWAPRRVTFSSPVNRR
jgi:hypothetical protein